MEKELEIFQPIYRGKGSESFQVPSLPWQLVPYFARCFALEGSFFHIPSYFLRFSFIFSSYLLHILHISSAFGCEIIKARRDWFQGRVKSFIFTSRVVLGILPSPTEAYDWSEFPTPLLSTRTSLRSVLRVRGPLPSYSFIFFLHISFIFHISSYFFIFRQHLSPKRGEEGGQISKNGLANFIFIPGVKFGIMIGRNFPNLSPRLAPRVARFRVIFLHISFIFLQHSGPKGRGKRRKISSGRAREFHIYLRGRARTKSHGGQLLVGIFLIYLDDSHLASIDFRRGSSQISLCTPGVELKFFQVSWRPVIGRNCRKP